MQRMPRTILVAVLLTLQIAYAAQANILVGAKVEMVQFDPLETFELLEIPDPQVALWRSLHQDVLPLDLSKAVRLASAQKLHALLSDAGLEALRSDWKHRQNAMTARQDQLIKRGVFVVSGGVFSLSFIMFAGVVLWRNERAPAGLPIFLGAPKRMVEMRRQALQEALGHLLALRDCTLVATAPSGDLFACRMIKRPRLKFMSTQLMETVEWMRTALNAGQSLEFASVKSQSDFERFTYWARCLRDADAAALGLRDLRISALELDALMKEAAAPPPVVVLPVYELNAPTPTQVALRFAS